MKDVDLVSAGKTRDGKPLFNVVQIHTTDPEIACRRRGQKDINCANMVPDEFGILRPKRSWLFDLYGSVGDWVRRR
jgi:hypothetical protein